MRAYPLLALALLAGACAPQPPKPPEFTPPPPSNQATDGRNRAQIHTELGASYYEIGQYGVALEEVNEALKADASYGPAYNVLGLVYMELREDALARENFERALRLNPTDPDANNNYGWFLCQRKHEDEAIKYFLAALKNPLYKTPEKSFVNAGVCARQRGDDVAALDYFTRALKARPDQPQALYNLADLAFRRADYDAAREYLTRFARVGAPVSAEQLWLAIRVENKLGDRDAVASYGLQLRKNFPNSKEARAFANRQFE